MKSWKNYISYIYRFDDLKLIQECPINHIYLRHFHFNKGDKSISQTANVMTIYGLERRNPDIEAILDNTYKKLVNNLNTIRIVKFNLIVSKECKNIQKYKLKQSIKNWSSILSKNFLLFPPRSRNKKKLMPNVKYTPPKEFEQEFKDVTENIWSQFNNECPPIGIMIQL